MAVYNRIYTKQKWDTVNKYNKNLMEDYLLEMMSQKKKQGTINQYKNDLRILFIFILEELDNKNISKLKKRDFRNYSLWLQEKNMSAARVNRMLSALRSMLAYAEDDDDYGDDIEINYAAKIKGLQKETVRDIHFLSMEQVEIIYNHLIEKEKYQQALLCALMIDSAGRRQECYQVLKDSITEDSNFTNIVIGKRGKKFKLLYNDMTKKAYKLYMEQRGEDDIDSLWITKEGNEVKQASYEVLYSWVIGWRNILKDKTGEYIEFNPHSFRHSALQLLNDGEHYIAKKLNKKFTLQELKVYAHHSSSEVTESYLLNRDEDLLLEAFDMK